MKKFIAIITLSFFLSGNIFSAENFSIGKNIGNTFIFNNKIQIDLDGDNWVVVRKSHEGSYGIQQNIIGIGRVENNEVMEMIEVYKGDLSGLYIDIINQAIIEILFKDKNDGCYERPEYYLLELYRKGSSHNCMIIRHMDVTKELNYPDSSDGKSAAAAYNEWIRESSLNFPKIMLESQHSYFSRLAGGDWIQLRHFINPKLINAPKSKFFSEETSEYHKINISQYPEHQEAMNKWIAISSEFHQNFEDMVNAKNNHKLNLDKYYMEIKKIKKMSGELTDQLNELNELYKTGALTKEEFAKAKKKLLN